MSSKATALALAARLAAAPTAGQAVLLSLSKGRTTTSEGSSAQQAGASKPPASKSKGNGVATLKLDLSNPVAEEAILAVAKASLGDTTAVAAIADPAAAEAASKRASKKRRRQEESPERAEALARYSAQGNLRSTEGGIGLKHAFSDRADETLAQAPLLHYRTRDGVDAGVVTAAEAAQRAGRSAAGGAGAGGAGAGAAGVTAGGEGESKVLSKSIFAVPLEKASEPAPLLHAPERKPVPMSKRSSLGSKWHNLPAQEITPELKKDLLILRNRAYMDPKRFYKTREEREGPLPRFFQVGTVQEAAHERFTARLTNKERKPTLVDALLADDKFKAYAKKNYNKGATKASSGGVKNYREGRGAAWKKKARH